MSLSHRDFLLSFGWNEQFEQALPQGLQPARVTAHERSLYRVQVGPEQSLNAQLSGRFRFDVLDTTENPAVGDWVGCEILSDGQATIQAVLPRKSLMQRKQSGGEQRQNIAANLDYLFIATSMNGDLNPRRLERYLTLAWDSGAVPVLLLTKADLEANAVALVREVRAEFPDVEVLSLTVTEPLTIEACKPYLQSGLTAAVVGSSGVGKSTLINHLIGRELLKTQEVRESDEKGRHTTTSRNLFVSRWGGQVIDTPGMRELQLHDTEEGLQTNFSEIEALALRCKFSDCHHKSEPGCAIQGALRDKSLAEERWQSYLKQLAEIRHYQRKSNKALASEEKKKWKKLSKQR